MPKIIYKTGDLLAAPEAMIVHGCNAQGVMKSGVAKLIREQHPEAYRVYMGCKARNWLGLGTVSFARSGDKLIANAITQEFYGREPGRVYVDYTAIGVAMRIVARRAADLCIREVAMPLIGAGLANGDWGRISRIIELEATTFQPVVYTLPGEPRGRDLAPLVGS